MCERESMRWRVCVDVDSCNIHTHIYIYIYFTPPHLHALFFSIILMSSNIIYILLIDSYSIFLYLNVKFYVLFTAAPSVPRRIQ